MWRNHIAFAIINTTKRMLTTTTATPAQYR
jgi:hypothetical protein